jgi:MoxR-like ATPase
MPLQALETSAVQQLEASLATVLRGKPEAVRLAVVCLLARGHLLIEDVPGVGKTTLAHGLARAIDCSFQRLQFTSDMLPSDVLGVTIYNAHTEAFEFKPGPIFTHFLLADEINRTTPKTQSALLEAMNENQVTVEGRTLPLPDPFMVIATQNPAEHHGTYPLPESQLDRFLMRLRIGYPDAASEREILRQRETDNSGAGGQVLSAAELLGWQETVRQVKVDDSIADYLLAIVEKTRTHESPHVGRKPARIASALSRGAGACPPGGEKLCDSRRRQEASCRRVRASCAGEFAGGSFDCAVARRGSDCERDTDAGRSADIMTEAGVT